MKKIALIAGLMAVAGCQTKPIEAMSYSEQKQLASQILARCHKQGVKPGTQEEKDCFYTETRSEFYNRRQNTDRIRAVGQAMAAAGAQQQAALAASRPKMTTCNKFGNGFTCNSW